MHTACAYAVVAATAKTVGCLVHSDTSFQVGGGANARNGYSMSVSIMHAIANVRQQPKQGQPTSS